MINKEIKDFKELELEKERREINNFIWNANFNCENVENLVELIGIILGDGHLHHRSQKSYRDYQLSVSLNLIDDPHYVDYVSRLIYNSFHIRPKIHPRKNSKGVDLKINNKLLVEWLRKLGLIPGNKVNYQINVPTWIIKKRNWIKKNSLLWIQIYIPLIKSCLRGLFDTDGSFYINRRDKKICLSFKNGSLKLVFDFWKMCNYLNIRTGKINDIWEGSKPKGRRVKSFYVTIQAKDQVRKFITLIKPKKWDFNKKIISQKLGVLGFTIEDALNYK